MNTKNQPVVRWSALVVYLGMILVITACSGLAVGSTADDILQVDNGVVQVQDQNGDLVPVAGEASFELVGELESMDPWRVAGKTFETNELTEITEGLETGNLVRVRGIILDEDTWLAQSIEPAEEQTEPIIILIGKVDSIDPWKVNGIELNVTTDTDIQGDITPGMLVRVEILLQADGTWKVLSIAPLGELPETSGCATVVATIVSVNGDEIQFLGWPSPVKLEISSSSNATTTVTPDAATPTSSATEESGDENEGDEQTGENPTLEAGQVVMAVVCVSDDGHLIIVQIIVLNTEGDTSDTGGGEKVLVCHNVSKNPHTISISSSALPAHLGHGDTMGPCP